MTINSSNRVLLHPQVTLIFWGTGFADPSQVGPITGAIQDMTRGPYFSMLNQYGGAGMPELSPNVIVRSDSDPPLPFKTGHDIGGLIKSMQGTLVPIANANVDNLYVVIVGGGAVQAGSPGDTSGQVDDVVPCRPPPGITAYGCHSSDNGSNGAPFTYAWAQAHARLTFSKGVTGNFSHEVAEAIVDPQGGNSEVGDICGASCSSAVGGTSGDSVTGWYNVAGYYSALDGRCVTPRAWGTVVHRNSSGGFDPTGAGPVRQAYASGIGIVVTDNSNPANVWALAAGSTSWLPIGAPATGSVAFGSMFGVTDSFVYALTPDQSQVWEFTGSGNWLPVLAAPSGGAFSAIYGGGANTLATATSTGVTSVHINGNVVNFGPMSALAVNQNGVYGLSVNHDVIATLDSRGVIARSSTTGYQTIFASPVLLSTTMGASVWNWSDTFQHWYRNGASTGFLASTSWGNGPGDLFDLDTISGSPQHVNHSPNVLADPPPTWSSTDTSAVGIGRLVNGGFTLYGLTRACPPSASKPSARTATCP